MKIVVMGVAGAGKSTVGALLAARLGLAFIDGDQLHPESNKQKMSAGIPLNDKDRSPWLNAIERALGSGDVVVACSALKRKYRDRFRAVAPEVRFIYLFGTIDLLADRLAARSHEYMPASMLGSQLEALEPPDSTEAALTINIEKGPDEIINAAIHWLPRRSE